MIDDADVVILTHECSETVRERGCPFYDVAPVRDPVGQLSQDPRHRATVVNDQHPQWVQVARLKPGLRFRGRRVRLIRH
jgi:hypothetical protein